jgi:adenine-specific DNA-methyltransferase
MTKLHFETAGLSAANIEKIAALFPSVITEALDEEKSTPENKVYKKAVNFEALKTLLGDDALSGNEAYEFTWVGKKASVIEAGRPIRRTLRPCKEESRDWDTTQNLYIEGDNLEVLKLLQESYLGKVKMIYIDPPYNTGNDFVYRDKWTVDSEQWSEKIGEYDEETGSRLFRNTERSGRFHSGWCSMIYPRLLLARNLLSDDGVIFISIDDNEVENLKKICNEIFGEENFVGTSTVITNRGGRDYGGIAQTHDYLIIYKRNVETELNLIEDRTKKYSYYDELGGFNVIELRNRNIRFNDKNRPNLYYPFYVNPRNKDDNGLLEISLEKKEGFIEVVPLKSQGIQTVWRWGKEKSLINLNKEIKGKMKQDGGFMIVQKSRINSKRQRSVWDEKEFVNERGSKSLKELFDANYFSYPKSPYLIKRVLQIATFVHANDIILDFFSGSATTAHAVMWLNAEDGGNRKYIMVQLPESCKKDSEAFKAGYKNICEIGKERIRRAGSRIREEAGLKGQNLDIGFRVFKAADSNMKDVYYGAGEYSQGLLDKMVSNIKEGRTSLDLLYACLLDWALPLSLPHVEEKIGGFTVYTVNAGHDGNDESVRAVLIACFDENISAKALAAIAKKKPLRAVFRDAGFASDSAKINVFEIFKLHASDTRVKVL